ncbi:transposase [Candidatus Wolfebacteria bacterium]|nr:transposase [Candidatus Wolfebacteria bacterium]
MNRPLFASGEIYHIYNRGVEKRVVFSDDKDHYRFIHDLFEFNDEDATVNIYYRRSRLNELSYEVQPRKVNQERKPRKLLVEILAFCLMPNHFHLLLRQLGKAGITRFMQKLGTGYTMYFNQRYERTGALFQGRFKSVVVSDDSHFIHLPYYIHANPLDLKFPEWRGKNIKNTREALAHLENYRWSSFLDYIGRKNFPSVTSRQFLLDFCGGSKNYKRNFSQWLREISYEELHGLTLE